MTIGNILRRPFSFYGRSSRLEYLAWFLIEQVAMWLGPVARQKQYFVFEIVLAFLILIAAVAVLATTVRRLHDLGCSGAWLLVAFIPLVNIILLIILLARPGARGPNKYGGGAQDGEIAKVF